MKRRFPRPIILTFPYFEVKPRILPFPRDGKLPAVRESQSLATADPGPDAELRKVRDRLFRMIVASQWNPSHGNRAS
ncbi:MAG: hypothetical protein AB7G28_21980 [Pirellulales bacterium]